MGFVTARDGARIFYKDWGSGPPVVLSHGWPLNADSWEAQQLLLAENGFRAVAHDRRGHGRSTQTWDGNEMDTYADDLAALIETLDLRDVTLVGFSTGGGEVARYIGRHGTARVAAAVLVSAVPPFMLRTEDNPGGVPAAVFDDLRAGSRADRSQLYRDLADGPFFGHDRDGADVSEGIRAAFWRQGLQSGHRGALECIAAFSATDFRPDLARFDVPTLVIHGDDDRVVPYAVGGQATVRRRRPGHRGARRGRRAEGLRGRPARHHRHAQGAARRRPARVPDRPRRGAGR
jgi:non-heme chloroperoxidase